MAQLLLLRGAKQLLTLRGPSGVRRGASLDDLAIVEDGSVLIQDGRITKVGPTRRLENLKEIRGAVEVSADGCVVMPGFIDPSLTISLYESRATSSGGHKRKKSVDFYQEALTLVRSCLQHGTVGAQVKVCSDTFSHTAAAAGLRLLAEVGANPIDIARCLRFSFPKAAEEFKPELMRSALATISRKRLVDFVELAAPIDDRNRTLLGKAGVPIHFAWPGGAPNALSSLLQQAEPRSLLCPAELSAGECSSIAQSSTIAVFSPCRDLLEERENPSAKKIAAAGGAIALASGYDSTDAPIFSMQMVVALAVLRLRLSVEQAISATTINAAHVLGRGEETGSLEVGKRADILVLNLSDYREIPRRFGVNHVAMVIRDGNLVINRKRAKASGV